MLVLGKNNWIASKYPQFILEIYVIHSDPSIEGTTPFKSCKSSNEVFYTEISNDPISKVKDDIRKKFHYDTWAKIVDIYSEIAY